MMWCANSMVTSAGLKAVNPVAGSAWFHLLNADFVAFARGSNDVGNAIAPLAAMAYINQAGTFPITGFSIPI